MFYEHNQVEDLLICVNCNERYDIPLLLTCWKSICNQCVKKHQTGHRLNCPYCNLIHEVPKNGLPINEALNSLLKLKPVDMQRASLLRQITDLLKHLQNNINNLDNLESNVQSEIFDYFDLIKKEINKSAQNVIEQAIKQRDKLITELEYLKEQSLIYIKDLFSKTGYFNETKLKFKHKSESFHQNLSKSNESRLATMLDETKDMNVKLDEIQHYINDTLNNRKLVFNQPEPLSDNSLIGQLGFNEIETIDHKLKIKYLNNLNKCKTMQLDNKLIRNCSHIIPMLSQRFLIVNKLNYDEFSDYIMQVIDFNGKTRVLNNENIGCRINAVGSYFNFILIGLTEKKSGRDIVKLYNGSLQLITTTVIESKSENFFFNDNFIYAKLGSNVYPFLFKFDYCLNRVKLFDNMMNKTNELFISFSVDKLIHISSNSDRIFFNDKCFSRIKIFSELNGDLIQSISINGLRDASIRVDESLGYGMSEQLIYLNKGEKILRLFDPHNGAFTAENILSDSIANISSFFMTKDGNYVFVDYLNDAIHIY